jgi:hypothetical protein
MDAHGELGLPDLFSVRDFEGSVAEWIQHCRWQFGAIVDGHIAPFGKPVVSSARADEVFWHVITDGRQSEGRRLNLLRCALIGRIWDVLERLAAGDPRACCWRAHDHSTRTMWVAPVDLSFVIVLRECRTTLLLVTAYPLGRRERVRMMAKAAQRAA